MGNVANIFNPNPIAADLFAMMAETSLGRGMSRHVYKYAMMKNAVIKFEELGYYQNVMEYETWDRVRHTDVAKWFAPCHYISPCGRILIQGYATDLVWEKRPEKIPSFFTDLKIENWGKYKGRPVCRDYGTHLMFEKGMSSRLKKAEWLC